MNNIQKLNSLGQSVWVDNISRKMIDSGELQRLIDLGVSGVTSNPTIFMKAITGGTDYDDLFTRILSSGDEASAEADSGELMRHYEKLVIPDIADAADILRSVHDRTGGVDGYISLEVNPKLAYNTPGTVSEGKRLFAELNRPNVFIKVPATAQGIPAIEMLIAAGVNVNVTLVFSIAVYREVAKAYISGLRHFQKKGGDVSKVSSVASFFVSRVDTAVDKLLKEKLATAQSNGKQENAAGAEHLQRLLGKAAIANARIAYERFKEMFDSNGEFGPLAAAGARPQRPLWASTSTKNPAYKDTIYVDELIGKDTVNTMPPETIAAFLDHGMAEVTIERDLNDARQTLAALGNLDVDLAAITDQLTFEGVRSFAVSFQELLDNLAAKELKLRAASA